MSQYVLQNPRLVNHEGRHDLAVDGVVVLECVGYGAAMEHAMVNMGDADTYHEPHSRPLTLADLRAAKAEIDASGRGKP